MIQAVLLHIDKQFLDIDILNQIKESGIAIGVICEDKDMQSLCDGFYVLIQENDETRNDLVQKCLYHFDVYGQNVLYVGNDEEDEEIARTLNLQFVICDDTDDHSYLTHIQSLKELLPMVLPMPGMKWYAFTIYFSLFFSAITNMLNGMNLITGRFFNQNGVTSEMVYQTYPILRWVHLLYGGILILFGLYAINVRIDLANYLSRGIQKYKIYLSIMIALPLVYLATMLFVGQQYQVSILTDETIALYVGQLISQVLMLVVTNIYYKKRAYLFH